MALVVDPGPGDGVGVDVPVGWDEWDHSVFDDALTDDPSWCVPLTDLPVEAAAGPGSVLESEPESLSAAGVIEFLKELQRVQSRLAGLEARALVAVAGAHRRDLVVDVVNDTDDHWGGRTELTVADVVREEVAAALHRSPGLVHDQIVTARLLAGPLAATGDALGDGRITAHHARVIADAARRFSTSHPSCHQTPSDDTPAQAIERQEFTTACERLQQRVLPTAERTTPGKTASRARAVVVTIDAAGQERRRQRAKARIDVHLYPDDDGLAVLLARIPLADAVRAHAALDARARHDRATHRTADRDGCTATLGQLRVTALLDALCATGPDGEPTHTPAATVTTEIQVVVPADTLLAARPGHGDQPGAITVRSHGREPLTAQAIRDLLTDPNTPVTLRRLVTDPVTGHLLDRGRTAYRVTPALRAFLTTRDGTCRHPGCTRPATGCQIDHAQPWNTGGGTDTSNLGALCTRHHQLKTHASWRITQSEADGTCTWTSPLGHTYQGQPPPVLEPKHPTTRGKHAKPPAPPAKPPWDPLVDPPPF